jgi:hypothetical protein
MNKNFDILNSRYGCKKIQELNCILGTSANKQPSSSFPINKKNIYEQQENRHMRSLNTMIPLPLTIVYRILNPVRAIFSLLLKTINSWLELDLNSTGRVIPQK